MMRSTTTKLLRRPSPLARTAAINLIRQLSARKIKLRKSPTLAPLSRLRDRSQRMSITADTITTKPTMASTMMIAIKWELKPTALQRASPLRKPMLKVSIDTDLKLALKEKERTPGESSRQGTRGRPIPNPKILNNKCQAVAIAEYFSRSKVKMNGLPYLRTKPSPNGLLKRMPSFPRHQPRTLYPFKILKTRTQSPKKQIQEATVLESLLTRRDNRLLK